MQILIIHFAQGAIHSISTRRVLLELPLAHINGQWGTPSAISYLHSQTNNDNTIPQHPHRPLNNIKILIYSCEIRNRICSNTHKHNRDEII